MVESPWRLIRDGPADGPWNMAVDEAIALAVGEGQAPATLRFYTWSIPTISFGYLQRTPGGVDLDACRGKGIPLVRRITGGQAVLHAEELTYSVAVPLRDPWRTLSIPAGFTLIAGALIAGLRRLGVEAGTGEASVQPRAGRETGACFLAPRLPAILVKGRKLIGSAQRRFHRSLLQHGSLLLDFDPHLHQAVFPAWPRTDPVAGVTSLRALLGAPPVMERLVSALTAGWGEVFGGPCLPGEHLPPETRAAEDLVRARYGNPAWTFQR
jgi:lipoate-protein ligase A